MSAKQQTPFHNLPPVFLGVRGLMAYAGTVGIDASAQMLVEAGEAVTGEQYVSLIAKAKDLTPEQRRKIADKMIVLWKAFAEGVKL